MKDRHVTPSGRAVPAADLTPEVCLQIARKEILEVNVSIRALIALTANRYGRRKRLGGGVDGLRAASVASPPHSIRVPMHLSRVPRG